jgi:hypothetical protein
MFLHSSSNVTGCMTDYVTGSVTGRRVGQDCPPCLCGPPLAAVSDIAARSRADPRPGRAGPAGSAPAGGGSLFVSRARRSRAAAARTATGPPGGPAHPGGPGSGTPGAVLHLPTLSTRHPNPLAPPAPHGRHSSPLPAPPLPARCAPRSPAR